jgi:hypothetical protein
MRGIVSTVILALTCAIAGCESDSSDAAGGGGGCSAFKACGGDIVGTWSVEDVCFEDAAALFEGQLSDPECDGTFRGVDAHASGTYAFSKDGVASSDITIQLDLDTVWSKSCLSAIAGSAIVDLAATCRSVERTYSMVAEFEGASCSVKGSACACLITSTPMNVTSSGQYKVEGKELVDVVDGDSNPFCVAGDTLTLSITSSSLSGQIILTRK